MPLPAYRVFERKLLPGGEAPAIRGLERVAEEVRGGLIVAKEGIPAT